MPRKAASESLRARIGIDIGRKLPLDDMLVAREAFARLA